MNPTPGSGDLPPPPAAQQLGRKHFTNQGDQFLPALKEVLLFMLPLSLFRSRSFRKIECTSGRRRVGMERTSGIFYKLNFPCVYCINNESHIFPWTLFTVCCKNWLGNNDLSFQGCSEGLPFLPAISERAVYQMNLFGMSTQSEWQGYSFSSVCHGSTKHEGRKRSYLKETSDWPWDPPLTDVAEGRLHETLSDYGLKEPAQWMSENLMSAQQDFVKDILGYTQSSLYCILKLMLATLAHLLSKWLFLSHYLYKWGKFYMPSIK